jgi:hypothetical protein
MAPRASLVGTLLGTLDDGNDGVENTDLVTALVTAGLGVVAGQATASKQLSADANVGLSGLRRIVNLAAATQTLTALQSGQRFVGAVDAVFTLPAAAAGTAGVWYDFECGAVSSGTGLSISPNSADAIGGNGLTVTLDKDLIDTGATDRLGDTVRIYCTGVAGATAWRIESVVGTWAKEA